MNFIERLVKCIIVVILLVQKQSSAHSADLMGILKQISLENAMMYSNSSGSELCTNHTNFYLESLTNGTYWAMQMFDSSTKIPESIFTGQFVHLGNFDECIKVENVQTTYGSFSGKHCLASVNLPLGLLSESTEMRTNKRHGLNALSQIAGLPNNKEVNESENGQGLGLRVSYCIPSTCRGEDFQNIFNNFLSTLSPILDMQATFTEDSCQTNEGRPLAAEDWVAVSILIFIGVLAVSSTAYDLLKKGPKNEMLAAFSWYSNGKKLLSTSSSGDTLQAVHGIRFLSMCWVVMGHRYGLSFATPIINLLDIPDMVIDFWRLYLTSGTLSVDSFFLLSGLLVGYVFLKQMNREKASFNIPLYYIHRYIRLTPPYAIMILLNATLVRYMSTGPMYPNFMEKVAEKCQNYWWTGIVYINNYYETDNTCLAQGWFLAVDMQLFILSPIILYPLWKWPRKWSLSLLGAFIISGLVTAFTVSFIEEIPATLFTMTALTNMLDQYYPTHTRFTPWLIGIGFGYAIYHTKKEKYEFSKMTMLLGWCIGIIALVGSFVGLYPFLQGTQLFTTTDPEELPTNFESSIFNALSRPAWALGLGWIVFACVSGYGGFINTFLSWRAFQPLSRLTYSVFLVHMTYQNVQTYSFRTASYFSDLNTIPGFFGDIIACLFLATVLSLCLESPIIILEKHLLGGGNRRGKENTETKKEMEQSLEPEGDKLTDLNEVTVHKTNGDVSNQEIYKTEKSEQNEIITLDGETNESFVNEKIAD